MTENIADNESQVRSQAYPTVCPSIAVLVSAKALPTSAASLAHALNLPLVGVDSSPRYRYLLVPTPERLELRDNDNPHARALYVDASWVVRQHAQARINRRQPLGRALGARLRRIVDATAGLGEDSFLLAAMGYEVTAVERCPVVAALLADGVMRASKHVKLQTIIGRRVSVVKGDARQVIPRLAFKPDSIYVDPMFPPKRKSSALTRKPLRVLRDLAGDDEDAAELLHLCLRHARYRVVVKRPLHAAPLGVDPSLTYSGKLARYDVYLVST
jgi:16S rRNA (guanine1516-N2)-methyltransferase